MRFIDLFAGIGGFHLALQDLGHECVFACEIQDGLRNVYEKNFGIRPHGDIKKIIKDRIHEIPEHDILCAGFPCQPFSKAGQMAGMEDKKRGTLFNDIVEILNFRRPKYFILENVPFIKQHDNNETWSYMLSELEVRLPYTVSYRVYSPHEFGIPQHRKRIFIVGSLNGLDHFSWPEPEFQGVLDVRNILDEQPIKPHFVDREELACIDLWQEFINSIPPDVKVPSFPIWAMEFGATYPYKSIYPHRMNAKELGEYKGSFGISLKGLDKAQQKKRLPHYALVTRKFPDWKQRYIQCNREFYTANKKYIQNIVKRISKCGFESWQKLEWNVPSGTRNIRDYILQFRASGLRVKKTDFFPSLVCTSTQVPIIGWQNRYITRQEGAKLQSIEGLQYLPENDNACFKALGNAVNSSIVRLIAKDLIQDVSELAMPVQPFSQEVLSITSVAK